MAEEVIVDTGGAEAPAAKPPARRDHRRPNRSRSSGTRTAATRTQTDVPKVGIGAAPAAARDQAGDDVRRPGDGEEITRVSRNARQVDRFALPGNWKKSGWDYEWKTHRVLNEPVDSSIIAETYEGGWRPVHWRDVPQPWTPGAKADEQITRYGQGLYTRPLRLTQEARQEEYQAAEQQKMDRVLGATQGQIAGVGGLADVKGVRPVNLGTSIEGEVGTMQPRPR